MSTVEAITETKRNPGRPDMTESQSLDLRILEEAARLFINQGFAATSMEQIAAAAGAGKQTIYRRYPSKEELFSAVIRGLGKSLVESASANKLMYSDPMVALRETARAFLDFICQKDAISLYRVLVGEGLRFPIAIDTVLDECMKSFHQAMGAFLAEADLQGQIKTEGNTETLVRALIGLLVGWTHQQSLLGRPGLSDPADRRHHFDIAWNLFLKGVQS